MIPKGCAVTAAEACCEKNVNLPIGDLTHGASHMSEIVAMGERWPCTLPLLPCCQFPRSELLDQALDSLVNLHGRVRCHLHWPCTVGLGSGYPGPAWLASAPYGAPCGGSGPQIGSSLWTSLALLIQLIGPKGWAELGKLCMCVHNCPPPPHTQPAPSQV